MADANNLVALLLIEEEEDDYEQLRMDMARIAAIQQMELEEGLGFDELAGPAWVPVTGFINEYHEMGDAAFKLHFRMTRIVFEALVTTVQHHLIQRRRLQRERTPFQDIMLMVVWLLATPDTFRSVALRFGVHPTTLHYFYTYVIEALRELSAVYIKWPEENERGNIKEAFERTSGFPGIIGCIDGTHVPITAPLQNAAQYRNRHHMYSINVQAVVDNNLLVRHVHVGEAGSMNDRRVFRRSALHDGFIRGDGRLVNVDEHLLGDGAYQLTDFMMIPFANNGHLRAEQIMFNRCLSQNRVRVENAFARAKGKWRRLKFLHARNQEYVVDNITAAFVLHNFIILNGEPKVEEDELMRPIRDEEVLGGEDFLEDNEELGELLEAAERRGIEKRLMIMNDVLPNSQQLD